MSGTWPRFGAGSSAGGAAGAGAAAAAPRARGGRRRAVRVERHHLGADLDLVVDRDGQALDDARRVRAHVHRNLVRVYHCHNLVDGDGVAHRLLDGRDRALSYRVAHRGHVQDVRRQRTAAASAPMRRGGALDHPSEAPQHVFCLLVLLAFALRVAVLCAEICPRGVRQAMRLRQAAICTSTAQHCEPGVLRPQKQRLW